jgi:predicted metalloprotease with PDZ domain
MRPAFPPWALLLIAAILFVGGLMWVRAHPPEHKLHDPLLEAQQTLAQGPGLEVAVEPLREGGVRVNSVRADSPAQRVGIKAGDRIIACGDQSVWHAHQLWEMMSDQASKGLPVVLMVETKGRYWSVVFGRPRSPAAKPPAGAEAPR